jgi:hypothetical protein
MLQSAAESEIEYDSDGEDADLDGYYESNDVEEDDVESDQ